MLMCDSAELSEFMNGNCLMNEFLQEEYRLIIVAVCMIGLWLFLRSKATRFESVSDFDAKLSKGQPLVLEFFSNG